MARTESTMVRLGTTAPAFELVDVITGRAMGRDDVFALSWDDNLSDSANLATSGGPAKKHGLLVMFLCVHCPYVKHVEQEIARIARDYAGQVAMCAIQSNDISEYPEDGPDGMRDQAKRLGWTFPYLLDEEQEVARSYDAACTPDFFLFNGAMELVYRGQLDDSRPRRGDYGNDVPVTGKDLRAALDAVIAGKRPDPDQRASIGCNIKWRQTQKG
ncbi:MAG TPA: thioredoxin family protein [Acidobacteriaceae bacterium]|nr:thioredoxin family protein [Acidobacteriaceae bacterium]